MKKFFLIFQEKQACKPETKKPEHAIKVCSGFYLTDTIREQESLQKYDHFGKCQADY